jgi:hypothetical protein
MAVEILGGWLLGQPLLLCAARDEQHIREVMKNRKK